MLQVISIAGTTKPPTQTELPDYGIGLIVAFILIVIIIVVFLAVVILLVRRRSTKKS